MDGFAIKDCRTGSWWANSRGHAVFPTKGAATQSLNYGKAPGLFPNGKGRYKVVPVKIVEVEDGPSE